MPSKRSIQHSTRPPCLPSAGRALAAAALWAAAALLSAPAYAARPQEHAIQIAFDTDMAGLPAAGCSWPLEDGPGGTRPASGIEKLLDITIDSSGPAPEISRIEIESCNNGSTYKCRPELLDDASWRLCSGGGLAGSDRVLFEVPKDLLPGDSPMQLYVSSRSPAGGRDALTSVDGLLGGEAIVFPMATNVPGLREWGALATAAVLLGLGLFRLPDRPLPLASFSGLVFLALQCTPTADAELSGNACEWSGPAPIAQDAIGDGTEGDLPSDLVALFVVDQGDTLLFRIDVSSLDIPVCSAGDAASSPSCDGFCGLSDDPAGPDCNGSCDPGELPSSPDCAPLLIYHDMNNLAADNPELAQLMQDHGIQRIPRVNKSGVFWDCTVIPRPDACEAGCNVAAKAEHVWNENLEESFWDSDSEAPIADQGYISMEWHSDAQDFTCTNDALNGVRDWGDKHGIDFAGFLHWHVDAPELEVAGDQNPFDSWMWDSKWRHVGTPWNDAQCDVDRLERGLWRLQQWSDHSQPILDPDQLPHWAVVTLIDKFPRDTPKARAAPSDDVIRGMAEVCRREADMVVIFEDSGGISHPEACRSAEVFLTALLGPSDEPSPCFTELSSDDI